MRLTPTEALRLAVAEEARARTMAIVDQGGELALAAMNLREAAEAYRLVADELHRRAVEDARAAR